MMNSSAVMMRFCDNASKDSISMEIWSLNDLRTSGLVVAVFEIIFIILGLPWNLIVLVTAVKERLYHQPAIILLMNLIISDLVVIVSILPFEIMVGIAGNYIFGGSDAERCKSCFIGLVNLSFSLVSIFTISMMSFDRFIFIYKPLHYEKIITPTRTVLAIIVAWAITILVTIFPTFGVGDLTFYPPFLSCIVDYSSQQNNVMLFHCSSWCAFH